VLPRHASQAQLRPVMRAAGAAAPEGAAPPQAVLDLAAVCAEAECEHGSVAEGFARALARLAAAAGADADAVPALLRCCAARGECARADFTLSLLYTHGVRRSDESGGGSTVLAADLEEARRALRRAALGGHAGAQLRLARQLAAEGDAAEAARFLRRAAEQAAPCRARAAAALALGAAYAAGAGVATDVQKAALWLRRAGADAAHAPREAAAAAAALRSLLRCANPRCVAHAAPPAGAPAPAAARELRACGTCGAAFVCCAACEDAHWAQAHARDEYLYDDDGEAEEDELDVDPPSKRSRISA
jgi:TPR repeat protein